jgi:hypothetical protein
VDGGNGGWQPFRSFRAHHRDYRERAVDFDAAERDDWTGLVEW